MTIRSSPLWRRTANYALPLLLAAGSLLFSTSLRQQEFRNWERSASLEIARINEILQFWLTLASDPLVGITALFDASGEVGELELARAITVVESPEISVGERSYAFLSYGEEGGAVRVLLSQGSSPRLAPDAVLDDFYPAAALLQRSLVGSERVDMSPPYRDEETGDVYVLIGSMARTPKQRGMVVAELNLSLLFEDLRTVHIPPGLALWPQFPDLPAAALGPDASSLPPQAVTEQLHRIRFAATEWQLMWRVYDDFRDGPDYGLAHAVLVGGLVLSLFSGALGLLYERNRQRTVELDSAYRDLEQASQQREQALGQLLRTEKLASLGALVAGVAHELNTPIGNSLTVATSFRDKAKAFARDVAEGQLKRSVLSEFLDTTERAAELLEHNIHRAADLVANFKQVAVDQTSERRRRFDLCEVVDEVLWTLTPRLKHSPHRIELAIPTGIGLDSYPGPLGQVITNLVNNSLTHAFSDDRPGQIRIGAQQGPGEVELVYSDNGAGIPPENLSHVFDPFFTTKLGSGGSGLGLHIVYNLITDMLGGRIQVDSTEGTGTRFVMHLPLAAPVHGTEDRT